MGIFRIRDLPEINIYRTKFYSIAALCIPDNVFVVCTEKKKGKRGRKKERKDGGGGGLLIKIKNIFGLG